MKLNILLFTIHFLKNLALFLQILFKKERKESYGEVEKITFEYLIIIYLFYQLYNYRHICILSFPLSLPPRHKIHALLSMSLHT